MTAAQLSPTPAPHVDVTVNGCDHRLDIDSAHQLAADLLTGLARLAQQTEIKADTGGCADTPVQVGRAPTGAKEVPTPATLFRRQPPRKTDTPVFTTSTGQASASSVGAESDDYELHPGVQSHIDRHGWALADVIAACDDPEQSWVSPTGNLARVRVRGDIGVVLSPISDRYIMSVLPAKRLLMQRQRHQARATAEKTSSQQQLRRITTLPDMLDALDDFGFTVQLRRSGHYKVTHPSSAESVTLPSSPSDHRWAQNALRDLRHTFGIDIRQAQAS